MEFFGIRELRENIGKYALEAESGSISVISKNGSPLTVNIPFDDTLIELGAHKSLAVKLYANEVLPLGKAAKLARMPTDEFISTLGLLGISVIGHHADDLLEELE